MQQRENYIILCRKKEKKKRGGKIMTYNISKLRCIGASHRDGDGRQGKDSGRGPGNPDVSRKSEELPLPATRGGGGHGGDV